MDQQCIFCGIANGSIPSKKVYEDDKFIVVLDIYPANPAHLLVMPKAHHAIFNQLSREEAEHLGATSKKLSELMFKVIRPEGINLFIANGPAAGQKAPHFILHVIPRFSGDGLHFEIPVNKQDEKELDSFYENLKKTLKNYFPDVDFEAGPEEKTAEAEVSGEKKTEDNGKEKKEGKPSKEEEDIDLDKLTEMLS